MALIYNASFDSTTRVLSLLDKAGGVISSCEVPSKEVDDPNKPLMLRAIEDNSSVTLTKNGTLSNIYQTSTNGTDWTDYTLGTKISLNKGKSVYFRCSHHPTVQTGSNYVQFVMEGKVEAWHNAYSMIRSSFTNTGASVGAYGMARLFKDCASLTKAPLLVNALANHCYNNMFSGCSSLTQAPVLPATHLAQHCYSWMFFGCSALTQAPELPATTLSDYCYNYMFWNCSALTQAPELPATTLSYYCYNYMFIGCTSLTQAPELPATTLAESCYTYMFFGCTSLTQAPLLPATTLAESCYKGMFSGCSSLTQAPVLPATTLAESCYQNMFVGCTSLTQAPVLPATTLAESCYIAMFEGCSALTQAPELPVTTLSLYCYLGMFRRCSALTQAPPLPATTLKNQCYQSMFEGCQSLKEVRVSATTTATDALNNWLKGVSATGDFYCDPNATIFPTGTSGIPENWRRLNINEEGPAVDDITKPLTFKATQDSSTVKLTKIGSPSGSFQTSRDGGNTWVDYTIDTAITLNTGDEVSFRAKTNRTSMQYSDIHFYFVMTGKIEAWHNVMSLYRTNDFATYESLVEGAFVGLFNGCTSLTKAPALPATTLAKHCCLNMFKGCQSLTEAPELPATTLSEDCYSNMFDGCQSLTKAPELPATTLDRFCYWEMFSGCSKLNEVRIAATTTGYSALNNWLKGVSATGDFYCDPNATIFPTDSKSGIPSGWTRHNIADYPN